MIRKRQGEKKKDFMKRAILAYMEQAGVATLGDIAAHLKSICRDVPSNESLSSYIRCIPEINRLTNGHKPRGMAEYEYVGGVK